MKPEQQNTEAANKSHIYVQKPDGETMNIPVSDNPVAEKEEEAKQTASNTPTTHSKEVTDGEDA